MSVIVDDSCRASDPQYQAGCLKKELAAVLQFIREEIGRTDDPKAQGLFDTATHVIQGLWTACDRYQRETEDALLE